MNTTKHPMEKLLKSSTTPKLLACATLAILALSSSAQSAVITWGSAMTFTGNATQVSNAYPSFAAESLYNVANSNNSTVNGVVFQNSANIVIGRQDTQAPGTTGVSAYQDILTVGGYTSNADAASGTFKITISGLTANSTYQVQVWTPFWADSAFSTRFSASLPDGATNSNAINQSPTLLLGNGGQQPQFVIGTFTADAATQNISYYGDSGYGVVGAVAVSTVPEPSVVAMLAFGGIVLVCLLARRRTGTSLS